FLPFTDNLKIVPERGIKYILRVNEYDKYEAVVEREKFAQDIRAISGKIDGQVIKSMTSAGVPSGIANEAVNRMSHMLDFRNGVHKGDKFSVKYDVSKAANGDVVKVGGLLSASFETAKKTYKIYRYKDSFYDVDGKTKKTGLDIKPLAARNARISSLFGYRRHPIYKTNKFHSGVDYAAPKGTAIYASGNGIVTMAQYVNGYGNYVKIRHNAEYETAYGHMLRFAQGIRRGVRVRKGQIIGYVGSTGRSTGPHLHFEIIRKGQKINPLKAKVATGNDLTGGQLSEFKRVIKQIDAMAEQIVKKEEAAPQLKSVVNILSAEAEAAELIAEAEAKKRVEHEFIDSAGGTEAVDTTESESDLVQKTAEETAELTATKAEKTAAEEMPNVTETVKETMDEDVEELSAKTEAEVAENNTDAKDEEDSVKYDGKIVKPILTSASDARAKYQENYLRSRNLKVVKVPVRKPKYASR
ncbi:MAG: M23 family metallopeptidase, partial [Alphaproteobacteria bacterium]|nr:M23 family metallopeptidase [Alphaproteobacteria bacterium]